MSGDILGNATLSAQTGALTASDGDLAGDEGAKRASTIFAMLQDVGEILEDGDGLRHLSVNFGTWQYVATVAGDEVRIVMRECSAAAGDEGGSTAAAASSAASSATGGGGGGASGGGDGAAAAGGNGDAEDTAGDGAADGAAAGDGASGEGAGDAGTGAP